MAPPDFHSTKTNHRSLNRIAESSPNTDSKQVCHRTVTLPGNHAALLRRESPRMKFKASHSFDRRQFLRYTSHGVAASLSLALLPARGLLPASKVSANPFTL